MRSLQGRVAIVTGGAGGLGRAHALALAAEGASVVVNDVGATLQGDGRNDAAAQAVVDAIVSRGGRAVASAHDVADWEASRALIGFAVESFGALHVLVNNAGIIRDRSLANMTEADFDEVVRVNLKGHFAPTRHAVQYWRECAKGGRPLAASVIQTSSVSGIFGAFGQANYGAAKMGVLALSRLVSIEAGRFGVRSNVIVPNARTRLSLSVPVAHRDPALEAPTDPQAFDFYDPANVSPVVTWLATERCPADAQVFYVAGDCVRVLAIPGEHRECTTDGRWTHAALDRALIPTLAPVVSLDAFLGYA
jgi:NAD(P)-dependent dehydrogenase (short-subunit alcohol dehydrogenase family)